MKQLNSTSRLLIAFALSFIICHLSFSPAGAQTPAFPGAEGHGRYVTGGRGGKVIHVTNLNDSGTGSLREAVTGNAKKIVVFDVGGVIALTKDLEIGSNTTILGQTAPKPGITLRYYTLGFSGDNIIVRFIRSRRGQEKDINDGADAIWTRHRTGIILDHCSFSWSIDEVASFYDNNNFTMQWCTIGESLVNAGHNKGAHGYGGIWGGKLASFHHNLLIHHGNRTPRFNGARYNWGGFTGNQEYSTYRWENAVQSENVDFRNCVVYNCGNGCYGGPGGGQINMVGNYYKSGPAATTSALTTVTVGASGNSEGYPIYWGMTSRYYVDGNQINNNAAGFGTFLFDNGTYLIDGHRCSPDPNHYYGSGVTYYQNTAGTDCVHIVLDEPAPTGMVTTHDAATAFEKVVDYAGASLNRDDVDTRYAEETRNGTATYKGSVTGKWGRIDLVSDVNGYTEENFGTGTRASDFDTDKDGIPDAWEDANGLNSQKASDALLYTLDPYRYYTNLEVYCNSLVQRIMVNGNKDATDAVDDYFPAYYTENEVFVKAINEPEIKEDVTFTLAASTNTGNNTSSTYSFDGGITITNTKSKSYAAGNNDGIKYSAGVQYTINLPDDVSVSEILFTGYDNYTDVDAYLSEVNGTSFSTTQYVFPKSKETVIHTIALDNAKGKITFTPAGKQVVLVVKLNGKRENASGIRTVGMQGSVVATEYYDLNGRRLDTPQRGISIRLQRMADGSATAAKIIR